MYNSSVTASRYRDAKLMIYDQFSQDSRYIDAAITVAKLDPTTRSIDGVVVEGQLYDRRNFGRLEDLMNSSLYFG